MKLRNTKLFGVCFMKELGNGPERGAKNVSNTQQGENTGNFKARIMYMDKNN